MKYFHFSVYEPGGGAEHLSGNAGYYACGEDLDSAKRTLVKEVGCTADYFDDPHFVKVRETSETEYRSKNCLQVKS